MKWSFFSYKTVHSLNDENFLETKLIIKVNDAEELSDLVDS